MAASTDRDPGARPFSITDLPMGPGMGQIPPANECHPLSWFKSVNITGNGMAQNTPHSLGRVPNMVIAFPVRGNNGAGAAGSQFTDVAYGVADATNVIFTATAGGEYRAYAI